MNTMNEFEDMYKYTSKQGVPDKKKRRPMRKDQHHRLNSNARFRFPTMAKLRAALAAIEREGIEVRPSGRVLVVNKAKRVQVENIIASLHPTFESNFDKQLVE